MILRDVSREARRVDLDEFDKLFGDHDDTFLEGPAGSSTRDDTPGKGYSGTIPIHHMVLSPTSMS